MAELRVDFTGDCSGLVSAAQNARQAISSLDGQTAGVAIQLAGADAAVRGLSAVGQARERAGGTVSLAFDASGVAAASQAVRTLSSDVRSASRELAGASVGKILGVQNDGSVVQLTGQLGQMSRALSGVSNDSKALGQVEQSASRAATSVGVLERNAQGAEQGMNSLGATSSNVFAGVANDASQAEKSMVPLQAQISSVSSGLRAAGGDGAAAGGAIGDSFAGASSSIDQATESVMAHVGAVQQLQAVASRNASLPGVSSPVSGNASPPVGGAAGIGRPLGGAPGIGGPPVGPPGGSGGSGGSGGHIPPTPPTSWTDDLDPNAGQQMFSGIQGMAGPAMMGTMIGLGATAITAAAGAGAVLATISHMPSAMAAATDATSQFGIGLGQATKGASVGASTFASLGTALHGLGAEVGQVGLQNMQTAVGGAAELTSTATTALKNMEPAIGPAISGMVSLGDAVLSGISSPEAVAGIKSVSAQLSDPANAAGISNIIGGLVSLGTAATSVVMDTVGSIGQVAGLGGAEATPGVLAGMIGAVIGGAKGGVQGAVLGGLVSGVGGLMASSDQSQGIDPTAGIAAGLSGYGLAGMLPAAGGKYGPLIKAGGALLGMGGTALAQGAGGSNAANILSSTLTGAELGATLGSFAGPEGTIIGGGIGAVGGAAYGAYQDIAGAKGASSTPPGQFPSNTSALAAMQAANQKAAAPGATAADATAAAQAQQAYAGVTAGQYGWNADAQGNLTPSNSPYGGGGQVAGGAPQQQGPLTPQQFQGGSATAAQQAASAPPVGPGGGRFGTEVGGGQTSAAAGVTAANNAAASSYTALGTSANTATSGQQSATQGVQAQTSALTQQTTAASNVQPALQQATSATVAATTASSQLAKTAPAATAAVASVAPAATAAVTAATSTVSSGGAAIGAALPTAMATGVTSNTSAACNASAQLAASTANCAASTLKTASPSKVFEGLGESTGQGLAVGIRSSMGGATSAVRNAMGDVVGAGAAGLAAHSPSEEFADLGSFAGQGLELGFLRNSDGTVSAVSNTTKAMLDAHTDAWNPDPATLPNPVYDDYSPRPPQGPSAPDNVQAPQQGPGAQDNMSSLNSELAQQNSANMPQGQLSAIQIQNTPHGAAPQNGSPGAPSSEAFPLGMPNEDALTKNLSERGWSPNTVNTVQGYLDNKQGILNNTMSQHDINHLNAETKVGMTGYQTAGGSNNPFDPKAQNSNQAYQAMLDRRSISTQAVLSGQTPNAVMADKQNASLGAGSAAGGLQTQAAGAAQSSSLTGGNGVGPAAGYGYDNYAWGNQQQAKSLAATLPSATAGGKSAGESPANTSGAAGSGAPAAGGAGSNFASSFGQGIASAASTAFASATSMATGAVAAVTSALGISSPSRVMMGHGNMTSEGFARGIRDDRGPTRAMRDMVRDAIRGGQDEWGRDWWNGWGSPNGPDGSSSGGGSSSSGGSGSSGPSGLGGPWGMEHGFGWDGHGRHHHGRHHGHDDHDRDDHGWGGDGGGGGGFGGGGPWGGDGGDRMAERFADRLADRGFGRGWGHDDHGGHGRDHDHHDDHGWGHDGGDHWAFANGMGSGGSGSSGSGATGTEAGIQGYHQYLEEARWENHRDHGRDRDRDHGHRDDHGRDHGRERDDHQPMLDHLAGDNLAVINSQSHQMGQSLAQGMAQGMQQNQSSVTEAAAMMAVAAVSTVRSQLGIASPSKVFYEIGGDAVKGFSHGLESGVGVIAQNSQSLSQIATEQMAQGIATGQVNQGYTIGLNNWLTQLKAAPNFMPFSEWEFDESQLGGLGSGVQAALDGTKSIAQSSGLQVGNVWARNIMTGADNVLQTSQFSALSSPAVGSALAETALGAAGQLGPAGSGAEYYNTASGSAGMVTMSATQPVQVQSTVNVSLDGQPFAQAITTAVSNNNSLLTTLINGARG